MHPHKPNVVKILLQVNQISQFDQKRVKLKRILPTLSSRRTAHNPKSGRKK